MEFACSHVVCNWRQESEELRSCLGLYPSNPRGEQGISIPGTPCKLPVSEHTYDNRISVIPQTEQGILPPPLPPRWFGSQEKPGPCFLPPSPLSNLPPPLPPRGQEVQNESIRLKANVNVLSLSVGHLVDISKGVQSTEKPAVHCGRCSAALSSLSSIQNKHDPAVWLCEFCGKENILSNLDIQAGSKVGTRVRGTPNGRDLIYLPLQTDQDYQNLEDVMVVFCVDISGSMSVTSEVAPGNAMRSPTYVSRLQSIQDALQRALSSLLQTSPHRRVAMVTFNDEVVVYGDGSGIPVTLSDWALVDYDYLRQQGQQYNTPHCIAESYQSLTQRVKELREHGATALGPAALVSVAMASRYVGSKVILCTDGRANIGLGEMEESTAPLSSVQSPYFYRQLANEAANSGVIVSVMTFEGTECRLAEVGLLADQTGGRVMHKFCVNIVNIGTVATEIQSALADNILATGVKAMLIAADGMYFPYEDETNHCLVREIGNVTEAIQITFQFACKPENVESLMRRERLPFQLQLSFTTRDQQRVTRIITEQRRVTTSSWVWAGSLNMSVLGVHCAQLCARLTMEGRVHEAQRLLRAQQDLLKDINERRPNSEEDSIYGNWIKSMTTICDDLTTDSHGESNPEDLQGPKQTHVNVLSDEAAKVVYQMKRASSVDQRLRKETDTTDPSCQLVKFLSL
ncbi:circularly permutated Ras protein 1 isoform X2 [Esox lucius]|uniref:circularly permutated Ras protein 1 isoform X2 n=1 Tax=Esox lucius TaxID=8010 RepID=UPI000661AA85|nr:circularly permutated Ras protein 1 isoform X2 [Esox lucius]